MGLTYAVVEMSKDTSVENNVLVGKDGLQPLGTATLQQTRPSSRRLGWEDDLD